MNVSVIYLARGCDYGLEGVKAFLASYERYPAGYPHQLIFAAKGWEGKKEEYQQLQNLAQQVNAQIVNLPDDGYDFGAFYRVALEIKSQFIFCATSSVQIVSDNWLQKLCKYLVEDPKLELVGTQGSWATTPSVVFALRQEFSINSRSLSFAYFKYIKTMLTDLKHVLKDTLNLRVWPNYHVRTHAYLVDRNVFIEFMSQVKFPQHKYQTFQYESGLNSLTNYIFKRNSKVAVVGADGKIYMPEDWAASNTTAALNPQNTVMIDKNSIEFGKLKPLDKIFSATQCWGASFSGKQEYLKFSVLIPTKNRLELLKSAIDSVLSQSYKNFEVIVVDNCSTEDVESYIESLMDDRLVYFRQKQPVAVTENWNTANKLAKGEYIIMLGDDDALLPGFLKECAENVIMHQFPEAVLFNAYLYMQPNVSPQYPYGYVCTVGHNSKYTKSNLNPFFLSKSKRKSMVHKSVNFDYQFGFNMQYFLYKREFMESLERKFGSFYQPPYPDYYTACLIMRKASSVLMIPKPLVVIGVTPKSYGYYYHQNKESEGMAFHNDKDYREYAVTSVKDKLCDICEMETAAFATFALLQKRLSQQKTYIRISSLRYYKKIVARIVSENTESDANKLFYIYVRPKAGWLLSFFLLRYFKSLIKHGKLNTVKQVLYDRNDRQYQNIAQLLDAIENKHIDF